MGRRLLAVGVVLCVAVVVAPAAGAQVLRVGTWKGIRGQFTLIQHAIDAAKPGDWILVAPGDYKTTSSRAPAAATDAPAGLLITTPDIWLRGMNRNGVVVDGTKAGSPKCSSRPSDQNYGPLDPSSHQALGLNGIMVWKANDVWVENLTACNFLGGSGGDGETGNEIWWNGGANSGKVGGYGYWGSYLNATSTFYQNETTAAEYGIFSSNWSGGIWDHTYASNFNDSGYYIGACQQICDQTVNDAWAEYNALGYSGSNSGGQLVIENSQFDNNEDGFDTNSQNGDNPPPQNGACPNNGVSPITHTHSCWVFMHNYSHDNNDPNVPTAGSAAAGPVGTGMSLSGGRNDTVMDNTFENNDAWGTIFVPYPDNGPPCTGGTMNELGPGSCTYDEWDDALIGNKYGHNGSYGNPTNGDFAQVNLENGHATDCYRDNTDVFGPLTSTPSNAEQMYPTCNGQAVPATVTNPQSDVFLDQVACDSDSIALAAANGGTVCPPGASYPRQTKVTMHPLPPASELPSMPNPCADAPTNPWCSGQVSTVKRCVASRDISVPLAVADRERFTSVADRVGSGRWHAFRASGRSARVNVDLGSRRHQRVKVEFLERIKVAKYPEQISFSRVYTRC